GRKFRTGRTAAEVSDRDGRGPVAAGPSLAWSPWTQTCSSSGGGGMNGLAGCVAAAELVNLPVSVGDMGDSLVVVAASLPRSSWVVSWCGDASAERPERGKRIDCRWTCGSAGLPRTGPSVEQQHVIPDVAGCAGGQCSNKRSARPHLAGECGGRRLRPCHGEVDAMADG